MHHYRVLANDKYVDEGISGSKERRPALDRLLSDCWKRLVDALVVYRYDRFARSLRQLVNALDDFRALGIDFVSLHEGVDTSTANGRLVFGIFASIAEFERELIRDRVRSGLALARSRGRQLGRPRIVVGASRVASLRAQGRSWAAISTEMGIGQGDSATGVCWLAQKPLPQTPRNCLICKGRNHPNLIAQKQMILLRKSGWGLEVGLFGPLLRGSYMLAYTQKTYAPLTAATGPIPPAASSVS
ncbi:MAG: recombinase family protein [Acidobacteriota bacterium]|jgi:hypothetical protein